MEWTVFPAVGLLLPGQRCAGRGIRGTEALGPLLLLLLLLVVGVFFVVVVVVVVFVVFDDVGVLSFFTCCATATEKERPR